MKKLTKPNLATCQFVNEDLPPMIMSTFHAVPSIQETHTNQHKASFNIAEEDSASMEYVEAFFQ